MLDPVHLLLVLAGVPPWTRTGSAGDGSRRRKQQSSVGVQAALSGSVRQRPAASEARVVGPVVRVVPRARSAARPLGIASAAFDELDHASGHDPPIRQLRPRGWINETRWTSRFGTKIELRARAETEFSFDADAGSRVPPQPWRHGRAVGRCFSTVAAARANFVARWWYSGSVNPDVGHMLR
jgi:hypothetical protein